MSSHHIVKEKQEPALIVDNLQELDIEILGQLLEWTPTVITNQESVQWLLKNEIHVDVVITTDKNTIDQDHITIIYGRSPSFKEIALNYLIEQEYRAVNILSQDLSSNLFERFASHINLVFIKGKQKIFAVKPGFKKWKPAGEHVYILADETTFQTRGLDKQLHQQYKTTNDGFFEIHFDKDYMLIAEDL